MLGGHCAVAEKFRQQMNTQIIKSLKIFLTAKGFLPRYFFFIVAVYV
jgi:hypothetical protein